MYKMRWLTVLGVISAIVVIVFGMSISSSSDYREIFTVLGVILSLIVIGLGEILYHLQNEDEDNGKREEANAKKDEEDNVKKDEDKGDKKE